MPRSAAARAMRTAISPRLAMRSFWKAMGEGVRLFECRSAGLWHSGATSRKGIRHSERPVLCECGLEWAGSQSYACKHRAAGRAKSKDRFVVLVEEVFHSHKQLGLIVQIIGPEGIEKDGPG